MTTPPGVPCRVAEPHEIPANAKRFAKLAEANGWIAVLTYARGTWDGGREPRQNESIALRLFKIGQPRLVGLWHRQVGDDKWKFHAALSSRMEKFGSVELRERITNPPKES